MTKKNTVTVDVDALTNAMAALIDKKIADALGNAAQGKPVYDKPTPVPAAPMPVQPEPVVVAPAVGEVVKLGDVELRLNSVSSRGSKYAGNVRGLLVDSRTGARFYLMGVKVFKAKSDEIPEGISFIASIN